MGEPAPEARVCDGCGRRYADPAILSEGRCPHCDGELVPLDEGPYPDPGGRTAG